MCAVDYFFLHRQLLHSGWPLMMGGMGSKFGESSTYTLQKLLVFIELLPWGKH